YAGQSSARRPLYQGKRRRVRYPFMRQRGPKHVRQNLFFSDSRRPRRRRARSGQRKKLRCPGNRPPRVGSVVGGKGRKEFLKVRPITQLVQVVVLFDLGGILEA